jgi:LPS export ABC transporter protein LptC
MLKPNKIKLLLVLCIVLAGLSLATIIVLKTSQSKGPVEILKKLPKNIDISLQKIHYTDIKDGKKRWDLLADKVEYDKKKDYTYFKNIRMDVFPEGQNSGTITLDADSAMYHNKTGDVEIEGKITAVGNNGMKFESRSLRYRASRSMIDTRDRIRFVHGRLVVEGMGMEFDLKAKTVKVLNEVTAQIGTGNK